MKFKYPVLPLAFVLVSTLASAQADAQNTVTNPCDTTTSAVPTVTTGKPVSVGWVVDPTVPASASDPTMVPNRINGFYVSVDGGAKLDIGLPTPGAACPATSTVAGAIPYVYRATGGVQKGSHTVVVTAYNFVLDASGNPTAVRQESGPLSIPFAATDPVLSGAPPVPKHGVVIR